MTSPARTMPLSTYGVVTLDGSGNGTAKVGPNAHGVVWRPRVVGVKVSTAVKSPTCQIYAGTSATAENLVDGTYTGELNSSDSIGGQVLKLGDYVFAVWTGGDAGAQGTVTVTGEADIG